MKHARFPVLVASLVCLLAALGCGNGGGVGPATEGPAGAPADDLAIRATVQGFLSSLAAGDMARASIYLSTGGHGTLTIPSNTLYFLDFGSDIHNRYAPDVATYPFQVASDGITYTSPGIAHVNAFYSGADGTTAWLSICVVKEDTRWLIDNLTTSVGGETGVLPLAVTGTTSLTATRGLPLAHTFTATGGTLPYTWSQTGGNLPPGVTLAPTGALSGTPTLDGTYTYVVQVTDAAGTVATANIIHTILP